MPNPLASIAAGGLVYEAGDAANDQGDKINSTQHRFATAGRALLTLFGLSQEALKRTLRRAEPRLRIRIPAMGGRDVAALIRKTVFG